MCEESGPFLMTRDAPRFLTNWLYNSRREFVCQLRHPVGIVSTYCNTGVMRRGLTVLRFQIYLPRVFATHLPMRFKTACTRSRTFNRA